MSVALQKTTCLCMPFAGFGRPADECAHAYVPIATSESSDCNQMTQMMTKKLLAVALQHDPDRATIQSCLLGFVESLNCLDILASLAVHVVLCSSHRFVNIPSTGACTAILFVRQTL